MPAFVEPNCPVVRQKFQSGPCLLGPLLERCYQTDCFQPFCATVLHLKRSLLGRTQNMNVTPSPMSTTLMLYLFKCQHTWDILKIALGFVFEICPRSCQAGCGPGHEKYTPPPTPSGNGVVPRRKTTMWCTLSGSARLKTNWFSVTCWKSVWIWKLDEKRLTTE